LIPNKEHFRGAVGKHTDLLSADLLEKVPPAVRNHNYPVGPVQCKAYEKFENGVSVKLFKISTMYMDNCVCANQAAGKQHERLFEK